MRDGKFNIPLLRCPHCGAEYLPSEIFIPNSFFGKQSNIEKTFDGKIVGFDGPGMETKESFVCEKCDTTFFVTSQVKFNCYVDEQKDFSKDYKTEIKINRLHLFEGND